MQAITIELNPSEVKVLKRFASSQVRTPENLAKFFIVKGLGLVDDSLLTCEDNKSATVRQDMNGAFVTVNQ